jgi:hypothetical protein
VGVHLRSADRAVEGQCEYLRRWAGYCIGKRQPWLRGVDDLGNRNDWWYRFWIDAGFRLRLNTEFRLWFDTKFGFWVEPKYGHWHDESYISNYAATTVVNLV